MKPLKLDITANPWLKSKGLVRLMEILNETGENARIVGGAVRDALMGKDKIGDIDIASKLSPEENSALLEKAGIKTINTGLKHGTITAIIKTTPYEITTLRRDITTDGRWANVEYTKEWAIDAARRDFTINALYMDMSGNIYDPLDGVNDLKDKKVRFIGNAEDRIREDALRILRFFRFSSEIAGAIDEAGLHASVRLKHMNKNLSGERVCHELLRILVAPKATEIICVMANHGLLNEIIPAFHSCEAIINYVAIEEKFKSPDALARLSTLLPSTDVAADDTAKRLKLSNKQAALLKSYAQNYPSFGTTDKDLRKAMYRHGKQVIIHTLLQTGKLTDQIFNFIEQYEIPIFPIQGKDLLNQGWTSGRDMGAELKRLENDWVKRDFKGLRF